MQAGLRIMQGQRTESHLKAPFITFRPGLQKMALKLWEVKVIFILTFGHATATNFRLQATRFYLPTSLQACVSIVKVIKIFITLAHFTPPFELRIRQSLS